MAGLPRRCSGIRCLTLFALATLAGTPVFAGTPSAVHQATGIKICEVGTASAIIWTRLTKNPEHTSVDGPLPTITYAAQKGGKGKNRPDEKPVVTFPADVTVDMLQGAAPGASGQTRVLYRPRGQADWQNTPWQDVDASRDFTRQYRLANLSPATTYEVRVEARPTASAPVSSTADGHFRTAPLPDQAATVRFTVITGQNYYDRDLKPEGWKIYNHMLALDPEFFVHTGDILYYDAWKEPATGALDVAAGLWDAHQHPLPPPGRQLLHQGRP